MSNEENYIIENEITDTAIVTILLLNSDEIKNTKAQQAKINNIWKANDSNKNTPLEP